MGERVPAVDGWFTLDDEPALLAQRCTACGTKVFPRTRFACPNPACTSTDFEEAPLPRTGRIWSYTTNHYAPPEPYVSPDPFEPYTVAAVELDGEGMTVLGQVVADVDPATLSVGDRVELVVDTLFVNDDGDDVVVWKWRPVAGVPAGETTSEVTA